MGQRAGKLTLTVVPKRLPMRRFRGIWLGLLLVVCPAFGARLEPVLEYKLSGLQDSLLENARAWLGPPPQTTQDRANFLASAEERVEDSLKALGYYNPTVHTTLQRTEPVWTLDITVVPGDPRDQRAGAGRCGRG